MITAHALLTLALSLLIAAQAPYVSPELRLQAENVANTAIAYANVELAKATQPASNTGDSTTYTPPVASQLVQDPAPATPVLTLSVEKADQEDTGRWNAEKGHGCYRTTIYVAAYLEGEPQKNIPISIGTSTPVLTERYVSGITHNGVKMPVAQFIYQPISSSTQLIRFSSGDATVDYSCQ